MPNDAPHQAIPWGQHVTLKVLDFEPDGDHDVAEALQIGGQTTGLTVKVGTLTDPTNPDPAVADASFVESAATGRYVRIGASSQTSVSGTLNILAPGVSDPIAVPYTTGAMPDQSRLELAELAGPFPGV
jgi:hypothetical protein